MPEPSDLPLPLELITSGGLLSLATFLAVALMRGWLWTSGQVDRLVAVKDQLIADKQQQIVDWRETARTEAERGDILAANQERALHLLESLAAGRQ